MSVCRRRRRWRVTLSDPTPAIVGTRRTGEQVCGGDGEDGADKGGEEDGAGEVAAETGDCETTQHGVGLEFVRSLGYVQ